MTKADLADNIRCHLGTTRKQSSEMLDSLLDLLKNTLESGESIMISGFGHFQIKQKRDRKGRNPQTGEAMNICARRVLTFKPSGVLRSSINYRSSHY